jgi:16S rRNA (adenine1518-N6/adenine1519-N6)-dimethyltransferase
MEFQEILRKYNFRYKKGLGQNFITDETLLRAIVRDAGVTSEDLVLEIGAGAGTLTRALAGQAKQVIAFEVDKELSGILNETLSGLSNIRLVFADVLTLSDEEITELTGGKSFRLVANLPYYITTPLVMRFIESGLPVASLTVMVQKEVADRFCALPNTEDYGAITLAIRLRGEPRITRKIGRQAFFPSPNVDSAVVRIDIKDDYSAQNNTGTIKKLIRAAFAMRRKTLVNNLHAAFSLSKEAAAALLTDIGYPSDVRGEVLSLEDYRKIAEELDKRKI